MSGSIKYFLKITIRALPLSILFLLSLSVRVYLLFEFPHVVFPHEADAVGYFAIAKNIVDTWGLGDASTHFPPFYPFIIGIVFLFIGDVEIAGRLAASIMGSLLVFPIYLIGKELYDKRVGYLSALIAAFLGAFIDFSLQPLSQTTYVTVLATSLSVGIVAIKKLPPLPCFLLGMVCGAAYLTRPEGLLVFLFEGIVISVAAIINNSITGKQKIKLMTLMLSGFLIMAVPYINYLHKQTGTWTISGKSAGTIIGPDPSAKLLPSGKTLGESMRGKVGVGDLFQYPGEFLKTYQKNLLNFLKVIPFHFSIFYLVLMLIGLIISIASIWETDGNLRTNRMMQNIAVLGGLVAVLPVFAFDIAYSVSYIMPVFPLFIILLSRGLTGIEDGFWEALRFAGFRKSEKFKKWALASAVFALLFSYSSVFALLFSYSSIYPVLRNPVWRSLSSDDFRYYADSQRFFLKDTGLWLKFNTPKEAVGMSRWSIMGFYADRKWIGLADGDIPEVVKYAKKHNVSYIVIDSEAVPRKRPKLAPLLNPSSYAGLRPVYMRESYLIRVIIYQVL